MKFKATEEQVLQMMANAVNASREMGVGVFHATTHIFTPEDMKGRYHARRCYIDYLAGRMVKLYIEDCGHGHYEIIREPDIEYQSWANRYPTNADLANSVGAEVYE